MERTQESSERDYSPKLFGALSWGQERKVLGAKGDSVKHWIDWRVLKNKAMPEELIEERERKREREKKVQGERYVRK